MSPTEIEAIVDPIIAAIEVNGNQTALAFQQIEELISEINTTQGVLAGNQEQLFYLMQALYNNTTITLDVLIGCVIFLGIICGVTLGVILWKL